NIKSLCTTPFLCRAGNVCRVRLQRPCAIEIFLQSVVMKSRPLFPLLVSLAFVVIVISGCCTFRIEHTPPASQAEKMAWWSDARFGMFIHWGIYSVPAGEYGTNKNFAEWFQLSAKMPNAEYAKYAAQFDPTNFNAKEWVKTAKDAGMK